MRVPDWFGSRRIGRRVGVLLLSLTVVTAVLVFGRTPLANAARSAFGFAPAAPPPAPPPPVISSFTPASGPVTTIVTISGSGFTGATQVRFGSITSPAIEFVNDSTLLATVPVGLGAPGTTITVDTPLGSATSGSIFGLVNGSAWINPSGGSFFTASNWSNNQVPTSSSDILITLPGFYTVTGPTGGTFRSLTMGAIGGSSNNQTLDINSPITFTNNIDVKHGGQFNLNGGTLSMNGLNVASTFNWNAGNISVSTGGATVFPNATFNINGVGTKNLGGRLTNQGFLNWLGATTINATTGTQINNTATGTFSIQNSAALTGPGTLNNQGNFQKISGTGTSNFASWSLQNSGTFFIPGDGDVSLASVQFSSPGTLETELGAVNTTKITTGSASITGGTLQLDNSLNRNVGDTFTIIASTSGSGNFSAFTGLSAGPGRIFQPTPSFPTAYRVVVVNAPPPTVGSFAPTSGITGSSVTVTGTNFFSVNRVTLNNVPTTFSVDSDTQLRFTVPPTATSGQIRVTTATGSATSSGTFSVLPLITTFSPSSGSPTQQVRIFGSGFGGATAVRFGGTSATFTVDSPNRITAVVPFGAATGPIRVTVGGNSFDSVSNFTVVPASGGAPSITGIGPGCATVGQGIVISGTNFLGVTQVTFNGRQAEFTVLDNTRIDAVFPGAASGAVTISVISPTGTGNSSSFFNGSDGTFSFLGLNTAPVPTVQARTGSEFAVAYADGQGTFVGSVKSLIPWNFSQSFGPVLAYTYDPVRADTIFAGIALPPGARPGRNSASNPVVFRSDDNGLSWNQADTSLPPEVILANVVIAFPGSTAGSTTVLIGTNAGIFRSDDRGATWTSYNTGLTPQQIDSLAYSPASGGFLYAGLTGGQVYTRPIGSGSWTLSSNGLPGSSASNFFVAADPGNGQVAYVAANDFQVGTFAVFKTTDRGANWTPANVGLPSQPASSLTISPAGNVLFVNVGGILYRSFDGGGSWSPVGVNLPGPVTTPVSFISNDGAQLLVGSKYGVFTTNDSGNTWSPLNRGFASPTVNQIAVGGNNRVYAQDSNGVLYRSTRDGASIDLALDAFEQDVFLRPAPSDGGIIYVGGFFLESNKLVKSTDGGATWFPLPAIGLGVRDLAVDPGNPDTLFLLRSSGLTRSTDGGVSFQSFGAGLPTSARLIRFVKANASILYAAGNGVDGVYRSTNGGANWSPVNTGLPLGSSVLITSIIPDPLDASGNVCLVGTNDARIFRTADGGANWTQVSTLPLTGYTQFDTTDFVFYSSSVVYASYYFQPTNPSAPPEGFIQVSNDGGATWSEFSPGSSIGGIKHLAMETGGSGLLYAGTTLGAFAYNTQSACPTAPVVTTFSPGSGIPGSTVTISGSGFTGATDISIAGFTSPGFTVVSDTQILAEAPNSPGNSGPVCVTTPFGTGCSNGNYTINAAPPTVTAFTPTSGSTGTSVTVTGTNFTGATSVTFNGTNAPGFTVVNDTTITVAVPSAATTGPISVTTVGGTGTSSTNFTVNLTYNWINPMGGDFNNPANWSSGFIPGPSDVAIIDLPGSYTVTSSSRAIGGLTLGGVSGTQTLIFNGNFTLNGPAIINPNGFFNFGDGTLAGSGTVTVAGQISFIGSGAVYSAGTLTIQSGATAAKNTSGNLAFNSPVNNSGTFITPDSLNVNAAFNNLSGAVFEVRGNGGFAGGGPFNIAAGATFRKTLGTSNFTPSGTPINNDGTVECQSGFIDLQGGGTGGGEFRSSAGASIIFRADYTFNNGAQLTGAGTSFLPGNVTLNGTVTMRNASIGGLGNTIGGAGNLIIPNGGTAVITGGGATFAGTGTIEVQNGGTFNLNGIGHTFNRTVNNAGLINWSQLDISIGTGAAINNLAGGFFRVQHSDRVITGTGSFNNAGTFEQPSGANVTVNVSFTNSGVINVPAVGVMTISSLVQTPAGAINTQLGGTSPGGNYSQLRTTNFTAAGTFSAAYINGFTASPGQFFDVITIAGSRTGTFSSVNLPPTGPGQAFVSGFKPNSFSLALLGTPSIASFNPTSGIAGTTVTLTGSNFTGTTSVTFNGTTASGFTVVNDTTITVNVPTGATTGTISVTNPAGTGTSATNFTVLLTPNVASFTPTSGPAGTSVTLSGTHFTGTTSVAFNGTNAPAFTVNSDTQITVAVPNGATTGPISVTNPAGTGTSSASFTVFQTPTVTSFTPTTGTFGTAVTITGANFNGTTAVTFNGVTASGFTVVNPTTITVNVPTGATTGPIAVTNPAGTGTSSANFNVILTFNWINPSGGDFNIGANWSSGVVPGPTDFAVIDLPGTYSVTITNVATTLGGLTLGGVSGTQTLVISNTFGGGFNLNGTGTVNPNGRITFNAGVLGGTGSLNLTAGSTMTLESAFGKAVVGTLNNAGTIAYVSGSSDLTVNGTLNNQSGGLFDIPTDNTITVGGALNNLAGATIRKSAGSGPSFITTTGAGTFDNFGTLLCQSGQLRPNSVRIQNGSTFTATGGGFLLLNSTSGTTTFAAGSPTFTSNGATLDGDLAGTGSFTGLLKFNAGTITGTLTVTSGSTLTVLNTTFGKAVSGTLNNGGTVNYFGPSFDLSIGSTGTVNNLSGGLFDLNTDNGLAIGTGGAFNNQAGSTFRKSGGTGTSVVASSGTFTNAGAIVAPLTGFLQINGLFTQTGTGTINTTLNGTTAGTNYSQLQLQSPTLAGTLNVTLQSGFTPAPGNTFDVVTFSGPRTGGFATVNLPPPANGRSFSGAFTGASGAAYRVTTSASFDWINPAGGDFATPANWSGNAVPGAGDTANFNLANTFTVTGTGNVAGITISGGAVGFNGAITTSALSVSGGAMTLAGGTFTLNGAGTVSGTNAFTFTGGTLGGTGTLALTGSGTFSAGTIASGTTFNVGPSTTLTLDTNGVKLLVGTMNNAGIVNFTGNGFQLNPGTFNNQAGAVFDLQANNSLSLFTGATFNNQTGAVLKKSGGTGISNLFGNVVNNGTLRSETGTMRSMALTVGDGSTYTQAGGLISLENQTTLASDATFSTNGARINGQVLGGPGTLASGSTLEFFGGTINDNVTLNISGGAQLLITGGVNKDIRGTINNAGAAIYSGTALRFTPGTPSVFNNQAGATFDIQGDGGIQTTGGGSFNNAGAFGKSVGTAASAIDVPFTNSGLLATPFAGGAFLQFNGNFSQTSAGTTAFFIGGTTPGNGFSQLQFGSGSTPSLAGTADVLLNNGFTPTAGQTFDLMTFTARSGGFGTVNLPPSGGGINFSSAFQPTSFRVSVNSTLPSVTSFTPTSGPVGTSVTITGVNFTGATAVTFNGTSATTFIVVNDTTITATVPTGATTGPISVVTTNGTGTSATNFAVLQPPTVTAFTPTSGGIGVPVTITGSGFTGATTVTFHLTPTTAFTVVDDTTITTTVPAGATTGPISVTTAGGTGTSAGSFTVITGFDWINPSGGNFNDGSNWSGGIVPGPMDTANFNLAAAYTVTGTGNVAGISQTAGNVTFNGTFTTGTFTDGGGSIALTNLGTLNVTGFGTVNHLFINNGGTLTIGNTFTVNGRLDMPSGTIQGPGDLLNNSTFNWDGGTVTGTGALIVNGISGVGGAFLNIGTSAVHVLNRNINASPTPGITGFVHDAAPNLTFGTGVTITNGGEYFVDVEKTYPATVTFNNTNRVNKVVGTGTFEFSGPFNNGGQVAVHTGEVRFTGGGTQISGNGVRYSALANGAITFAGGSYTLGPGDVAGGQPGGLVRITGATVITLASDFAIGDPTRLEAGATITGPGSLIVIDTGTLDWRGGTIGGETGSGNLVINNGGGQLLLNGPDPKELLRTLLNDGLVLWNDGTIQGSTTTYLPTIQNRSTGIFQVQNDGDTMVFNGSFINQGLFEKPSGSGTNLIRWNVQNEGILRVPSTTGILFIEQFVQTSAGFLEVTVGGSSEGVNLSQLQTIDSTLAGTLNILLAPGFTPTQGQSFPVITFDTGILRPSGGKSGKGGRVRPKTVSGDFDVLNGTGISGGLSFRPVNAFSAYSLKVVGAPVITSFSPAAGPAGTSVLITGLDFDGATSVQFNGTEVSSFTVSPLGNQITTTVPTGATTGPITVTTQLGTGTSSTNFVVNAGPTITSFTPTSGPIGTIVTITGANFTGATSVTFNGTATTGFTVDSDTQITAAVPNGATTGPLTVTTPNGTATSSASFTVTILPPVITSVSPASGPVGTLVTINGNNFNGVTSVQFNGVEATFSINPLVGFTGPAEPIGGGYNTGGEPGTKGSRTRQGGEPISKPTVAAPRAAPRIIGGTTPKVATAITATVPAGATTGFITVTGPGGTATSPTQFVVLFPPTITAFTPTQGQPGDPVIITGTNFTGATSVTFGGIAATNFTVNSATQITAAVPTGAISGKIAVTTPDGTGTSAADFIVCGYTVTPTTFTVPSAGGDRSVSVTTFPRLGPLTKGGPRNASLCPWTAVSNSPFITILTGATGTGNGTVTFRVAAFAGGGTRVGTITVAGQTVTITQQPSFVAGDFNGDLKSDLLWRNFATGATSIWLMNGTNFSQNLPLTSSETCWFVGGVNDFTGDGQVDILWRNQTITGANGLWRFNGSTVVEGLTVTPDQPNLAWVMNCTGDFNGDGKPDIVLRNSQTGAAEIWLMNGVNRTSVAPLTVAGLTSAEQFVGSGDFNGDGRPDLLVRNQAAGTLRVVTLNGTTPTGTLTIPTLNSNWELSAVGDFNTDGQADLVWRNLTDGSNVIWLMNGTTLIQSLPFLSVTDPNWRIVGPK